LSPEPSSERVRELLHRKALAAERHRAVVARGLRLTDTEAAALAHLAHHGELTPGELGRLLGLTSGGMTALIHRLEAAGHLERRPHPHDRRRSILAAADSLVDRAVPLYAPLVGETDEAIARLTPEERRVVIRFLEEVVELSERHVDELAASLEAKRRAATGPIAPPAGLWG
jgi:DNA-binding MarR family transcriptional regulator